MSTDSSSTHAKVYVVYRTPEAQDVLLEATGYDVATFPSLQDAAHYARALTDQTTQLRLLGVAFTGAFAFHVKSMEYTDHGIRYKRVVLEQDTELDGVEYETEAARMAIESREQDRRSRY